MIKAAANEDTIVSLQNEDAEDYRMLAKTNPTSESRPGNRADSNGRPDMLPGSFGLGRVDVCRSENKLVSSNSLCRETKTLPKEATNNNPNQSMQKKERN
jgi:hypothetical protein